MKEGLWGVRRLHATVSKGMCLLETLQYPQSQSAEPCTTEPSTAEVPARRNEQAVSPPGGRTSCPCQRSNYERLNRNSFKIR